MQRIVSRISSPNTTVTQPIRVLIADDSAQARAGMRTLLATEVDLAVVGEATWTEFCVRFVFDFPEVRTTIGATSRLENLHEFCQAAGSLSPLPGDIQAAVQALQHAWAEEHDRHAEPWSM